MGPVISTPQQQKMFRDGHLSFRPRLSPPRRAAPHRASPSWRLDPLASRGHPHRRRSARGLADPTSSALKSWWPSVETIKRTTRQLKVELEKTMLVHFLCGCRVSHVARLMFLHRIQNPNHPISISKLVSGQPSGRLLVSSSRSMAAGRAVNSTAGMAHDVRTLAELLWPRSAGYNWMIGAHLGAHSSPPLAETFPCGASIRAKGPEQRWTS